MKKLLAYVLVFSLLISLASALTVTMPAVNDVYLCGADSTEKIVNFQTITVDENISTLRVQLTSENGILIAGENMFEKTILNYVANESFTLGEQEVIALCQITQTSDVSIVVYDDNVLLLQEVLTVAYETIVETPTNPPNIVYKSPQGDLAENNVKLRVDTDQEAICKYDQYIRSFNDLTYTFTADGNKHFSDLYLENGAHEFYAICQNTYGINSLTSEISFSVNGLVPLIIDMYPTVYESDWDRDVRVMTDGAYNCYYSFNPALNTPTSMSKMSKLSESYFEFYFDKNEDTAYLLCESQYGKVSSLNEMNIMPEERNQATISMDNSRLVSSGMIDVDVILTQPAIELELSYLLIDSGGVKRVPLEGDGKEWSGIISIPEGIKKQLAEFELYAIDGDDRERITIDKEKYFIVDPVKPMIVTTLELEQIDGTARLEWTEPSDDVSYYYVYRKINSGGVNELHFYQKANYPFFIDTGLVPGNTYYYRISAVDESGNEGFLSNQYEIKILDWRTQEEQNSYTQDELGVLVDAKKKLTNLEDEIFSLTLDDDLLLELNLITTSFFKEQITKQKENLNFFENNPNLVGLISTKEDIDYLEEQFMLLPEKITLSDAQQIFYSCDTDDVTIYGTSLLESQRKDATSDNLKATRKTLIDEDVFLVTQEELNIDYETSTDTYYRFTISSQDENEKTVFINLGSFIGDVTYANLYKTILDLDGDFTLRTQITKDAFIFHTTDIPESLKLISFSQDEDLLNQLTGNAIDGEVVGSATRSIQGIILLILLLVIIWLGYRVIRVPKQEQEISKQNISMGTIYSIKKKPAKKAARTKKAVSKKPTSKKQSSKKVTFKKQTSTKNKKKIITKKSSSKKSSSKKTTPKKKTSIKKQTRKKRG